ncbi:MAG: hypothetical protein LBS57_09190 [Treponema sp.]|jgi:hypothetical protein|nr:hypothetical protein [Treponema sp.]
MKKRFVSAVVVCVFTAVMAFAQDNAPSRINVKAGLELDAVAAVQVISYNHETADGKERVADPLVVGGFGREDGNRSKLTLKFTADYMDKAGLYTDISFFPWWQDNRDQDLLINIGSIELGQLGGWFRPLRWLKVNAGRFEIQDLRGKIDGYNWRGNGLIGAKAGSFDSAFTEFNGNNAIAVEIIDPFRDLFPALKGLYFAGMIYNLEELGTANNQGVSGGYAEAKYMAENLQIALGYTIEDIGLARFQYIGIHHIPNIDNSSAIGIFAKSSNDDNTGPRLQAAFTFDSSLVPGLLAEVGGTLSLPVTDPTALIPGLNGDGQIPYDVPLETKGKFREPHRIAVGAQYGFGGLGLDGLAARIGVEHNFGGYSQPLGSTKTEYAPVTRIWFSPSYSFTESFKLLADLGVNISGNQIAYGRVDRRGGTRVGGGVFAQYTAFGSSFIRVGVVYSTGYTLGETPAEAYRLDDLLSFPIQFHWEF